MLRQTPTAAINHNRGTVKSPTIVYRIAANSNQISKGKWVQALILGPRIADSYLG